MLFVKRNILYIVKFEDLFWWPKFSFGISYLKGSNLVCYEFLGTLWIQEGIELFVKMVSHIQDAHFKTYVDPPNLVGFFNFFSKKHIQFPFLCYLFNLKRFNFLMLQAFKQILHITLFVEKNISYTRYPFQGSP